MFGPFSVTLPHVCSGVSVGVFLVLIAVLRYIVFDTHHLRCVRCNRNFWRLDPSHLLQFRQAKRGRKSSAASIRSVPPSRRHSGAGGEERTSATADLWAASVDL